MKPDLDLPAAPWARPGEAVLRALDVTAEGLSSAQATARLAAHGPNELSVTAALSAWRLWLRQFQSPLVLILLLGAGVAGVLAEWIDAALILAIVGGSTLLGFTQELRASRAVALLRRRLALQTMVRRDGQWRSLPVAVVVPGDLVQLRAGDLVLADARVLSATDFLVAESSLTGEPYPVHKGPDALPAETPLARRAGMVHLGTSVRSGTAEAVVVATGARTVYGAIAAELGAVQEDTEFARGLRRFGAMLMRVMTVIVIFVLAMNHALGRPVIDSLLFAVALAVGLSPELLPAIVSVTLSAGARAMARRGVIVRRLEAIENLGSIDVLCTDKTGTLTVGEMRLLDAVDADGASSGEVAQLAFVNSSLETGIANPIDEAIVRAGKASGRVLGAWRKVAEVPFDFTRKRLSVVVAAGPDDGRLIVTKGAFDNVVAVCTAVRLGGAELPLDATRRAALGAHLRGFARQGLRCIAVAARPVDLRERYDHGDERALVFQGFVLISDPPKPGIGAALAELAGLGIDVKIVSGDNRHVCEQTAREVGLDPGVPVDGAQLAALSDEGLRHVVGATRLFVEVDPQQKERIVRALQQRGRAVGYLGDGINDAPALQAADVGISVDDAVDVARESADVVLLRPDLDVLIQGVRDGRATFANTLKYITITTSANFGNMVSMALANPLLPFLPLTATQILLNNLLSDLPSVAIATDRVDPERVEQAQRWNVRDVTRFMLVFGLVSTVFDLLTFALLLYGFGADARGFQTAWFVESLLTELAVLLLLRTRRRAWRSRPGALLLWTSCAVAVLALAVPYLDPVARLFGFAPLPPLLLGALVAIVLAYAAVTEAVKRIFWRASGPDGGRAPSAAALRP